MAWTSTCRDGAHGARAEPDRRAKGADKEYAPGAEGKRASADAADGTNPAGHAECYCRRRIRSGQGAGARQPESANRGAAGGAEGVLPQPDLQPGADRRPEGEGRRVAPEENRAHQRALAEVVAG